MKINEVVSLEKQRVDEGIWAPFTAAVGGGLSYLMLAAEYGYNPGKWPKKAFAELAADVAIGATGVGLLGIAGRKALLKGDKAFTAGKAIVKNLRKKAGGNAALTKLGADTAKTGRRTKTGQFTKGSNAPTTPTPAVPAAPAAPTTGPVTRAAQAIPKVPGKLMRGAGVAALAKTQAAQDLGAPEWVTGGTRKLAKAAEPHLPTWFPGKDEEPAAKKDGKPVAPAEKPKPKPKPKPEKKRGPTALQQWKWGKGGRKFPGMDK